MGAVWGCEEYLYSAASEYLKEVMLLRPVLFPVAFVMELSPRGAGAPLCPERVFPFSEDIFCQKY